MRVTPLTILVYFFPFLVAGQANKFQEVLDEIYEEGNYPGMYFSTVDPEGKGSSFCAGFANKELNLPMTEATRLLSGSTGKTFVSAIIMQLVGEDKIELDNKVEKWLGAYEWFDRLPNAGALTVKNLLQHQSGIPRYVFKAAFMEDVLADANRVWKPAELIAYVLDDEPSFQAGEGFAYADTNYILLGMIIENIENDSYYGVLEKRILAPLNLIEIVPTDTRTIAGLAQGYPDREDPLGYDSTMLVNGVSRYNLQFEWTGGGLAFTTREYATWLKLLFEGNAFSLETAQERATYFDLVDAPEIGGKYGLGFHVIPIPGHGEVYGHGGFFPGYYTFGMYLPKSKVAMAMQVNTTNTASLRYFFRDLMRLASLVPSQ